MMTFVGRFMVAQFARRLAGAQEASYYQNVTGDIQIRPYEPRDRAALREIACDTADSGNPVERFFPDREVFADALTRYYTDLAPEATWIAECDGTVVGYLTGCLDTRRYLRAMVFRIGPLAFLKALVRGILWHPQTRQLFSGHRGEFSRTQIFGDYPAHLHINFRVDYRGKGGGRELMDRFLQQVRNAGICGVHAGVSEPNEDGRRFFELFGFVELGREPRVGNSFTIVYGKRL